MNRILFQKINNKLYNFETSARNITIGNYYESSLISNPIVTHPESVTAGETFQVIVHKDRIKTYSPIKYVLYKIEEVSNKLEITDNELIIEHTAPTNLSEIYVYIRVEDAFGNQSPQYNGTILII